MEPIVTFPNDEENTTDQFAGEMAAATESENDAMDQTVPQQQNENPPTATTTTSDEACSTTATTGSSTSSSQDSFSVPEDSQPFTPEEYKAYSPGDDDETSLEISIEFKSVAAESSSQTDFLKIIEEAEKVAEAKAQKDAEDRAKEEEEEKERASKVAGVEMGAQGGERTSFQEEWSKKYDFMKRRGAVVRPLNFAENRVTVDERRGNAVLPSIGSNDLHPTGAPNENGSMIFNPFPLPNQGRPFPQARGIGGGNCIFGGGVPTAFPGFGRGSDGECRIPMPEYYDDDGFPEPRALADDDDGFPEPRALGSGICATGLYPDPYPGEKTEERAEYVSDDDEPDVY